MNYIKKHIIKIFFLCTFLITTSTTYVYAKTSTIEKNNLDIMFVLDSSYSMTETDSSKLALDVITMFIDTLPTSNTRIGYVAYNDSIVSHSQLMEIKSSDTRKNLSNDLRSIKRSGYTDIGIALNKSFEILETSSSKNNTPIIIVLSDGETDIPAYSDRTVEDSNKDVTNSIQKGKENSIPIYTIALGDKFTDTNMLKTIANNTNGKYYETKTSNNLVEILTDILNAHLFSNLTPLITTSGTGEIQSINIPIKDNFTSEANVLFISSSPINQPTINYVGTDATIASSKYYFSTKILNPPKQEMELKFVAAPNDEIKVYLIADYNISMLVDEPENFLKNKEFTLKINLKNNDTGKIIEDADFYKDIQSTLNIISDNDKLEASSVLDNHTLKINQTVNHGGDYKVETLIKHANFKMSTGKLDLKISNSKPTGNLPSTLKVPVNAKVKTYDLNNYFKDSDKDSLKYEIVDSNIDSSNFFIEDNILTVNTPNTYTGEFQIKVSDNDNASITSENITLKVLPTLQYYYLYTILVLVILTALVVGFILYRKSKAPKPTFTGKIDGYFIKLRDEDDIPAISFALYQMQYKKQVSLQELLLSAKIDEPSLNADKILFLPGLDREIVFINKSDSTILLGSSVIKKDEKYVLHYKDKIYITFDDGISELELHYNKA